MRALAARAAERDVYERASYLPLHTSGMRSDCLFAFARGTAITCVPRMVATLTPDGSPPLGPTAWGDTRIQVTGAAALRDVFTGAVVTPTETGDAYTLDAAAVFERFPVALLVPDSPNRVEPADHPS
jgi:(1->4)-alpha-D-glucan 1-alpha-D-glucosylmutase